MGIFYIFFTLFPCVVGQLQERWLRHVAKKWISHDATVTQQTLGGAWAPTVEIRYQFDVNGESHDGNFQRRYQNKTSAGNVPIYEVGAGITVLVDPNNPDRSYFPLPLSIWGLLYAAPIAGLAIAAVLGGFYSGLEQRRFDARHRIPEADWRRIRYSRLFDIRLPGEPQHGMGTFNQLSIDDNVPVLNSWVVQREGYSFTAAFGEYPKPPAPDKVFVVIRKTYLESSRQSPAMEQPLIYAGLKAGRLFRWPESTGRLFQYAHPDWASEVYVSGRSVYVMSTNWYVQSDVRAFFDSMQPTGP